MATKKEVKPKKVVTPEQIVTRLCNKALRENGWRLIRQQRTSVPGAFSTGEPGMPDYQAVRYVKDGVAYMFWIEYKSPAGSLRKGQPEWHERERKLGALVVVVDDAGKFEAWYDKRFGFLHAKELKQAKLA